MEGSRPPSREQTRSPIMEADIDDTAGDVDVRELGAYAGAHLEAEHIVAREEAAPPEIRTIASSDVSLLGAGIESLLLEEKSVDSEHKARCEAARHKHAALVEFICSDKHKSLKAKYSALSTDKIDQLSSVTVNSYLAEVKAHLTKVQELSKCEEDESSSCRLLEYMITVELHKNIIDKDTSEPIGEKVDLNRLINFLNKVIKYTDYNFFYYSLSVEEQQKLNFCIHQLDDQLYNFLLERNALLSTYSFDIVNKFDEKKQVLEIDKKYFFSKIEYFYGVFLNSLVNIRESDYERHVIRSLDPVVYSMHLFQDRYATYEQLLSALKVMYRITRTLQCVFFNKFKESPDEHAIKSNYKSMTETQVFSLYSIRGNPNNAYSFVILNSDLCSSLNFFTSLEDISKAEVQSKRDKIVVSFYSIHNFFTLLGELPASAVIDAKIFKCIKAFNTKLSNFKTKVDKEEKKHGRLNTPLRVAILSHIELGRLATEVKAILPLFIQEKARLKSVVNNSDSKVLFSLKIKERKITKLNSLLSNLTFSNAQNESYLSKILTRSIEINKLTKRILKETEISSLHLVINSISKKTQSIMEGFAGFDFYYKYVCLTDLKKDMQFLLQKMEEMTTQPEPLATIEQLPVEAQQIQVSEGKETRKQRKAREAREFKQQKLQKAKSAGLEVIEQQVIAITSDPAADIVKAKQLVTQSDKSLTQEKEAHETSQQNAQISVRLQNFDSGIKSMVLYPFELTASCLQDIGLTVSKFFYFVHEAKYFPLSNMGKVILSFNPKKLKELETKITDKAVKLSERYKKMISTDEGKKLQALYEENYNKIWQEAEDASIYDFNKCKMKFTQYLSPLDNQVSELNELLIPFKEIIVLICELSDDASETKASVNKYNQFCEQQQFLSLTAQIQMGLHQDLSADEKL